MKPDASHIRQIHVVSNTHWDREFRRTFEKTRRRLLTMMDVTLDILEADPAFPSFTMDGHSIMIDDYLEMRPERREQVEGFIRSGRLIIGPWYTLPETMSIGHEALARNFLWGRRNMERYGAPRGTVAYTPASWGQTGQLPQILANFGLTRTMFYRGISHHESDAEFRWQAPDGTELLGSRFAIYARYNWYYQVHRAVTRGRTFTKDYVWGEFDEAPFRFADGLAGEDLAFDLKDPSVDYDGSRLKKAIEDMVEAEGPHFTTEVFLAMHGHDISVAHPLESRVVADAQKAFEGKYAITHTNLEDYWDELEKHLDREALPVLKGERRAHLVKGMWTYLLPASISARTYLKLLDFAATTALVSVAEPLASLASAFGVPYPSAYVDRGWEFLLSNHTHDANGGCAPDEACLDIEYRYRKARDCAEIVMEDAMGDIARRLSPAGQPADAMQLIVFNPLPFERDAVALVDLEIPAKHKAGAARLESPADNVTDRQPVSTEKSSSFVDSIWDVPTILDSHRLRFHARLRRLPGLGWRAYTIVPEHGELRHPGSLVTGSATMENECVRVTVNANGTIRLENKQTGRVYDGLGYLSDQGEAGNAWRHVAPRYDRVYTSLGVAANVSIVESGPLVARIAAEFDFPVPVDYADGTCRAARLVALPIRVVWRLEAGSPTVKATLEVDNRAKDHWLRVCFPTGLETEESVADSHFDVVRRAIAVPDSTGWVERFEPTHPLRTFVDLSDGSDGLAVFTKGLFEYEAREDAARTLLVSLIRSCRIKLAVSEEKQTELPDQGVQCPGPHTFEFAVHAHAGTWEDAGLPNRAAEFAVPVRAAMIGRGKGDLPLEASLFAVDNAVVHVTAVKQAEDGRGLVVRLYNGSDAAQDVALRFGRPVVSACRARMDESAGEALAAEGSVVRLTARPHAIVTLRVEVG
ncbi:MAG: 2-O-(6-phospho-alpha-D-mannosyl)-D-glycerate hydrolase [Candidatus Sumerlaeota bacterium]|nr:2-O-(6-phospho-alpha-D-mannosyl)-D-glycerate hydrolase [Candidatus Sumerlaeota bacterium]